VCLSSGLALLLCMWLAVSNSSIPSFII
jgi:hypothetical protein